MAGMKGYLYTLEVLIAVSLIMIVFVFLFNPAPLRSESDISIAKKSTINVLEYLDNTGDLARIVADDNEKILEDEINARLPPNIFFETDICTQNCSTANIPSNLTVSDIDYYISAYKDQYLGKRIKIWIWT